MDWIKFFKHEDNLKISFTLQNNYLFEQSCMITEYNAGMLGKFL